MYLLETTLCLSKGWEVGLQNTASLGTSKDDKLCVQNILKKANVTTFNFLKSRTWKERKAPAPIAAPAATASRDTEENLKVCSLLCFSDILIWNM